LIGHAQRIFTPGYRINIPDIIFTMLPVICLFYLNYLVLTRYFTTRLYFRLLLSEVLLFFTTALLYYVTGYIIGPLINKGAKIPAFVLSMHLLSTLWTFMAYNFFSCGYFFARQAVKKEKQLRIVALEKVKIEQEKLQAEYAFLRAQINPHFLHNTLNFFYAKSLGCSKELSDGILTLCEIMRYSLKSGEDEDGTVLLSKEVEHMQNVIRINQLRFSNRLQVDFSVSGDAGAVRIIPLILITLLENAFKHGDLIDKQHPLTLQLTVNKDEQRIYFFVKNKKKKGPKEPSHGIGMDNIRRRLLAAYKNNCSLQIQDEKDFYSVELSITVATVDINYALSHHLIN
jgi:sensor histidine kinase YesM